MSDERFMIDVNTRVITVPPTFTNAGVISDHNALKVYFEIGRTYDGEDLSTHNIVIQYINAKGEKDVYSVTDKDLTTPDKIIFSWELSNHVTKYAGTVSFAVRFYSVVDNKYTYTYGTQTASFQVLDGIVVGLGEVTVKPDILALIPDVPDWALNPAKPSYTANEVGALPDTADASFVHKSGDETINGTKTFTGNVTSPNLIGGDTVYGGTIVTNLDAITKNGFYTCYGTAAGVPNSSYSWFVIHQNSNAGTTSATQRCTAYGDNSIVYERKKVDGVWKDFVLQVSRSEFDGAITDLDSQLAEIETQINDPDLYNIPSNIIKTYGLENMNFAMMASQRHFYDINMPLWEINPKGNIFGSNSSIYPKTNVTTIGVDISEENSAIKFANSQGATEESYIRLGGVQPYAVYDFEIGDVVLNTYSASIMLEFRKASGDNFNLLIKHGLNRLGTGVLTFADITIPFDEEQLSEGNYTVRVHVMGTFMAFFYIKNGVCKFLGDYNFYSKGNFTNLNDIGKWSINFRTRLGTGESVELKKVNAFLTCGCGQADMRIIKTTDGKPITEDGKVFMTMSCRGFEKAGGQSNCGVFKFDPSTLAFELTGQIFEIATNGEITPCVGVCAEYDEVNNRWIIAHSNKIGVTQKDIRHGISYAQLSTFEHPYSADATEYKWVEDPDIYYDKEAEKYIMTFAIAQTNKNSALDYPYSTAFVQSDNIFGPYTEIVPHGDKADGTTGQSFAFVGGDVYVTAGTKDDNINIYSYPSCQKVGQMILNTTYGGFRTWGCIIPYNNGFKTRYVMIVFDRNRQYGAFSYGNLFIYQSIEMNPGNETGSWKNKYLIN